MATECFIVSFWRFEEFAPIWLQQALLAGPWRFLCQCETGVVHMLQANSRVAICKASGEEALLHAYSRSAHDLVNVIYINAGGCRACGRGEGRDSFVAA